MEKSGLNLKEIKARNKASILYLLNRDGAISRKDIAEKLSLTPAGVTKLCSELIEEGLIAECGEDTENSKAGRKKILLTLKLDNYYALCINSDVDKVSASVVRLDGVLITETDIKASENIVEVIELAEKVLLDSKIEKDKILCTAICVIGKVSDRHLGLWDNNKLKALAKSRLQLPVIMDNNIEAFALAELIYGNKHGDGNVLFLKWGPGIASAIVNDGEVLTGANSDVTEIGHYIVNKNGRKCRCGRYGCLETEVSTHQLESELEFRYPLTDIINSNDRDIINLIDSKIDLVAIALTNTSTILASNKIVLFGSMFNNEEIAEKIIRQCNRYNGNFEKNTIALSRLNDKINYIGPAAIAARRFFFEAGGADKIIGGKL